MLARLRTNRIYGINRIWIGENFAATAPPSLASFPTMLSSYRAWPKRPWGKNASRDIAREKCRLIRILILERGTHFGGAIGDFVRLWIHERYRDIQSENPF